MDSLDKEVQWSFSHTPPVVIALKPKYFNQSHRFMAVAASNFDRNFNCLPTDSFTNTRLEAATDQFFSVLCSLMDIAQ